MRQPVVDYSKRFSTRLSRTSQMIKHLSIAKKCVDIAFEYKDNIRLSLTSVVYLKKKNNKSQYRNKNYLLIGNKRRQITSVIRDSMRLFIYFSCRLIQIVTREFDVFRLYLVDHERDRMKTSQVFLMSCQMNTGLI